MKKNVTCRYGVKYELEAHGSSGACFRLFDLMAHCCCFVCHNRECKTPRDEKIDNCNNICDIWFDNPPCEKKNKPS
jgi:hypothetical protein